MTVQRRRGDKLKIFLTEVQTDNRGNKHKVASDTEFIEEPCWEIPQRSARAEVPGQAVINVIRIGIEAELPNVDLWSRVELRGKSWDVVTPPAFHRGTRHVRHWTIDLRERP